MKSSNTPSEVQAWIIQPPHWLEVRPNPPSDPATAVLDPGERAALALAELLKADKVLIDDLQGRREAERRRLHVTGTLGVLAEAHLAGLLDFDLSLARLRTTNFRLAPEIERLARKRLGS